MVDDGPATLLSGVLSVLGVPFQVPSRLLRARLEARQTGAEPKPVWSMLLIWLAFVPVVVAYEAMALPLVAGTVAFCIVLIAFPAVIGRAVRAAWRLVRRGAARDVAQEPVAVPASKLVAPH